MRHIYRLPAALLVAGALLVACGDSGTNPGDAPADHTVSRSGVSHAPGLNSPQGTCTVCHGADLTGGANGEPSCFSCHGRKWN
jgi:cytochrome c5